VKPRQLADEYLCFQAGQQEIVTRYGDYWLSSPKKGVSRPCTAFLAPRYGTWLQYLRAALHGVAGTCGS